MASALDYLRTDFSVIIAKMKNFLNSHSRDQKVFIAWYKQSRFKKSVDGNETPHRGSVSFLIF